MARSPEGGDFMSGRVLRVIGVIVAVLALLTIVLLILVKTIFTPVVSSAPKTAPGQTGDSVAPMTRAEAIDRAQGVLSQLGIDPGPLR